MNNGATAEKRPTVVVVLVDLQLSKTKSHPAANWLLVFDRADFSVEQVERALAAWTTEVEPPE